MVLFLSPKFGAGIACGNMATEAKPQPNLRVLRTLTGCSLNSAPISDRKQLCQVLLTLTGCSLNSAPFSLLPTFTIITIFTKYRKFSAFPVMMLIADSGSTQTTWILADDAGNKEILTTSGINPMYQDEAGIYNQLKEEFRSPVSQPVSIYFYGAGCINNNVNLIVKNALERFFSAGNIHVSTDLVAAARSLCQRKEGIACILGTGSNSCYYDGIDIVKNVSPLGYMLGDEGSGAVLGKKLLADILKNQLPREVCDLFFNTYSVTRQQIMENVYKKPFPNRYLAQFTRFINDNRQIPELRNLVRTGFVEFFERNVSQYPEALRLPVHFTGSIAFHFQEILFEAAGICGYKPGTITSSPSEGLIKYHQDSAEKND